LQVGMQMRRNDDGQWVVSGEPAAYASTGNFSSGRGSGFKNFRATSSAGNLQSDNSNPPPDEASGTGTDTSTPETAPSPGNGNDALARLMQRRAQEEQQLGQGQ